MRLLLTLIVLVSLAEAVVVTIQNHWNGGFQGQIDIPITKEMTSWRMHLTFDRDVTSIEVWAANVQKVSNREYILTNHPDNGVQHVGNHLTFTFLGHGTGDINPTTNAVIEGMVSSGTVTSQPTTAAPRTNAPSTGGGTSNKNYADALGKSILFYDAQRSGKLPANNPIHWRGDSALQDCVVGGWYDAGDHVKFGFPMASSATLLLWGLQRFKDGYENANQLTQMYDMIKWPLDYFLHAWNPQTKQLVVQVGDGNTDHAYWGRPEDMTMARPCFRIEPGRPGSDVAAETAAALAAGSIVFKAKGDTAYASQLLTAAESLYAFAKANRGIYSQTVQNAAQFYSSSGDKDEMCVGAMWLYKATRNNQFLTDAKANHENAWGWALAWDDKKVACQLLLFEETHDAAYRTEVEGFFQGWLPGGSVTYTPCGLAWRDKWGANRYAGNAAFGALVAAEDGVQTARYRTWAIEQINYLLGDNHHDGGCYSFEIGYGSKYPRSPHHRAASCPNRPAPCTHAQLDASGPSPQLLVGALVGGPDAQDNYVDDRNDYVMNEVATDYNSGFQSALAAIVHLQRTSNLPPTHNKCPCH